LHGSYASHAWLVAMRLAHGSYASRAWLLFAASRRAGAGAQAHAPWTDKTRLEVTTTTETTTTTATTTTIKG